MYTEVPAINFQCICLVGRYGQFVDDNTVTVNISRLKLILVIGFIANELISIVENAGLMGIPLPAVIANAIDILTQKADKKGDA